MRAINEDDVKRLIRAEKRNWTLTQFPGVTEALNHVEGGLVGIRTVESQIPRWVSVEERLPETCRESRSFYHSVSVLAFEKGRIMLGYFDTCKDDGAWCFVGTDTEEYYDDCAKPTHWMPLPESPKEECP